LRIGNLVLGMESPLGVDSIKHCYPAPLQYISRYALNQGVADFPWNAGRFGLEYAVKELLYGIIAMCNC
jgi:hypothetical protein